MAVFGVLVTYRRPEDLRSTLVALRDQSHPLDRLVIVDNDPDMSAAEASGGDAVYVSTGENLGPAGGIAAGIERVLELAGADDWLVLLDDDNPPESADQFERLVTFAASLPGDVGATGLSGSRYNRFRGQPQRVPDGDLSVEAIEVDWIGGNQLPLYRCAALSAIRPDQGLFFGFDDLDLGLRLRRAGWRVVIDGVQWQELRVRYGLVGLSARDRRASAAPALWRRYYTSRNLILIARSESLWCFLAAATVGLARSVVVAARSRPAAAMAIRGVFDGVLGRAGRRVDPGY